MSDLNIYYSDILDEFSDGISNVEALRVEKKMLLAARIDRAIKNKGWLGKDLAEALHKSPSEISKWLSGTHNFTTDTLWDIEQVLDIELILLDYNPIEVTAIYSYSADRKIRDTSKNVFQLIPEISIFKSEPKSARSEILIESNDYQYQG